MNTIEEKAAEGISASIRRFLLNLVIARDDLLSGSAGTQDHEPRADPGASAARRRIASVDDPAKRTVGQRASSIARIAGRARRAVDGARATFVSWSNTRANGRANSAGLRSKTANEPALRASLHQGIREHSVTSETLFWLCREARRSRSELVLPDLLGAVLSALERDQHNETARGSRLRDLVLDDRELFPGMFREPKCRVARDSMRRLMLTPVFDDLTKRSFLARIIQLIRNSER